MKGIYEDIYKGVGARSQSFNEELESEFHAVIKRFNLPMDREAIAAAGFVVEREQQTEYAEVNVDHPFTEIYNYTATITQHGKPVSRTIRMNDARVDSKCLAPVLKALLISDGVLCEVMEDLKRMSEDATKTLQELLDSPERGDFNCTEISVDPKSHLINRVVCLGKEYKG